MMRTLWRRIYRERRRLFLCTILLMPIAFFVANKGRSLHGIPDYIVLGVLLTLLMLPVIFLLTQLFPSFRQIAEGIVFINAVSAFARFGPPIWGWTWISTLFIFLAWLLIIAYLAPGIDRFLPAGRRRYRSRSRSRLTPAALWPYVVIHPDHGDKCHNERTVAIEWIEPGRSYREVERLKGNEIAVIEERAVIEEFTPPHSVTIRFATLHKPESNGASGRLVRRLEPVKSGTRLETIREYDRGTLRMRVVAWVDDAFGRLDDEIIIRAEKAEITAAALPPRQGAH